MRGARPYKRVTQLGAGDAPTRLTHVSSEGHNWRGPAQPTVAALCTLR